MLRPPNIVLPLLFLSCLNVATRAQETTDVAEPQLAHMVFFTLSEPSEAHQDALIRGCEKHLTGHAGTVYFSAGHIVQELDRGVNDTDFHVALHIVFSNKQAHDDYQTHPRHLKFIDENKQLWSQVRVFDSYVRPPQSPAKGANAQEATDG